MYISHIKLRDWKAYTTASFEFPAPAPGKNIVLIGAPNGYGKTSLFEAVVLGIFGKEGLPLIARSPSLGKENRPDISYTNFLGKTLNHGAKKSGRNSCSVHISFVDDNEDKIEIQRIWHFNIAGNYQNEETYIFEGPARKPVGPPNGHPQTNRQEWYKDYITQNFLPFYLANFFLFDGEQVSAFAEKTMAAQVRIGIEGLLGIPILHALAADLRAYATKCRRKSPDVSDKTIEKVESERDKIKSEKEKGEKQLEEINPALLKHKKERNSLMHELSSYGVGSQAKHQEQIVQISQCRRRIEDNHAQLENRLARDIALSLTGRRLRENLKKRLKSESIFRSWEAGKQQGDSNLERFLSAVDQGMENIKPTLNKEQRIGIIKAARNAWTNLWYPPPENCAENYLHPYLNEAERSKVIDYISEIDKFGSSVIIELLNSIEADQESYDRLENEITRAAAIAPHVDEKRDCLKALNVQIENLNQQVGALGRENESRKSQINTKNVELEKLMSQRDLARPSARRASRASTVSNVVDEIIGKAVPSQIDSIAKAMTDAHRAMSHKEGLVKRIDINNECDVKLLNSEGIDVRDYDQSAGEKQIFTQALISAVASVSGRAFPMVIDTPLGRLDVEHRKGVLRHLTKRGNQVILLSTNTEVVGDYLREILPHVQAKYLINYENVGEFGQSSVLEGYFYDEEVNP